MITHHTYANKTQWTFHIPHPPWHITTHALKYGHPANYCIVQLSNDEGPKHPSLRCSFLSSWLATKRLPLQTTLDMVFACNSKCIYRIRFPSAMSNVEVDDDLIFLEVQDMQGMTTDEYATHEIREMHKSLKGLHLNIVQY